jgi:SET domain-containing protein
VIDATMHGARIIPGALCFEHLKQAIIIVQRDIEPHKELPYDYQVPLELDLEARIPCNCHSEHL